MEKFIKINKIVSFIFAICLSLMSDDDLAAQQYNYRCDESSDDNTEPLDILSNWDIKPTPIDTAAINRIHELNENHRCKVVQPNADSHFMEIDSILSSTDYNAILFELNETVVDYCKNKAAWFLNCVVPNYAYFEVRRENGGHNLDFDLLYIFECEHDYAITIHANDLPRRQDFTVGHPRHWEYVWEKGDKVYLFRDLMTEEFHTTNDSIKLPYDPNADCELWKGLGLTTWTFPIKDNKVIGTFVTFHFADIGENPTIDLLNNTYVYPQGYLRKEVYEKLPYWNGQQ